MSSPAGVVLVYHRVGHPVLDPHTLAVTADEFEGHLAALKAHFEVVPLLEVQARGSRRPRVAVTFDDGYADNAEAAAPLLQARGMPATFFITTGPLQGAARFWWDTLTSLVLGSLSPAAHAIDVEISGQRLWLDARDPAGARRAHDALHRRLLRTPSAEIERVLDEVAVQVGVSLDEIDHPATMTAGQIRALADEPLFTIGAHSVRHANLTTASDAELDQEIAGSRGVLEGILGESVSTFAYPFGGPDAVDTRVEEAVRKARFTLACTTLSAPVTATTDPVRTPRLTAGPWSPDELAQRLMALSNA